MRPPPDPVSRRLAAAALAGALLLFSPILGAFNRPEPVAAVPLLPLYLFGVWAALIAVAWAAARRGRR